MATGSIDAREREPALDRLERESFDCVVIGAGITGAGVAREAAARGLSVALLEAEDFASGTSSRSSKLIHGGLRYLAMGDVATVRSTALERKVIHRLAPHLAEPLWLVVPVRSRAGLLKMRAAITTYEKLGAVEGDDLHRNWSRDELAEHEPLIDRERYPLACVYREYLTDDARLVLANVRAAVVDGAAVASRARVTAILQEGDRAVGVEACCGLSGRTLRVRARCVINAAGPWVDAVRALEDSDTAPLLHLSKGVHITLRRERVPLRHMVLLNTRDKRTIFAIPRGRCTYVGTTDTTYAGGHTTWPEIDAEDVEYLLEPVSGTFAGEPLRREDVVGAWAGLRPLIAQPGRAPTEISRKDEVLDGPAGVVTIAGGKLTGYRPMARQTVEHAAARHALTLAEPGEETPLPGGDFDGDLEALAASLVARAGLSETSAARLARLYGTEAPEVADRGAAPLEGSDPDVLEGEAAWAVTREGALGLEDVIYRRLRLPLYHPDARESALEPVARQVGRLLGWDAARTAREVGEVRARLASELAFQAPPSGEVA